VKKPRSVLIMLSYPYEILSKYINATLKQRRKGSKKKNAALEWPVLFIACHYFISSKVDFLACSTVELAFLVAYDLPLTIL
jgi:hypothetical protein